MQFSAVGYLPEARDLLYRYLEAVSKVTPSPDRSVGVLPLIKGRNIKYYKSRHLVAKRLLRQPRHISTSGITCRPLAAYVRETGLAEER